jgi:hypothetical protein
MIFHRDRAITDDDRANGTFAILRAGRPAHHHEWWREARPLKASV